MLSKREFICVIFLFGLLISVYLLGVKNEENFTVPTYNSWTVNDYSANRDLESDRLSVTDNISKENSVEKLEANDNDSVTDKSMDQHSLITVSTKPDLDISPKQTTSRSKVSKNISTQKNPVITTAHTTSTTAAPSQMTFQINHGVWFYTESDKISGRACIAKKM